MPDPPGLKAPQVLKAPRVWELPAPRDRSAPRVHLADLPAPRVQPVPLGRPVVLSARLGPRDRKGPQDPQVQPGQQGHKAPRALAWRDPRVRKGRPVPRDRKGRPERVSRGLPDLLDPRAHSVVLQGLPEPQVRPELRVLQARRGRSVREASPARPVCPVHKALRDRQAAWVPLDHKGLRVQRADRRA